MKLTRLPFLLAAVLALAACSNSADQPGEAVDASAADQAAQDEAAAEQPAAPEEPGFDIASVPISDVPVAKFPYFPPPPGYHTTPRLSGTIDRAVFPFRVDKHYIAVEGRVYQANIRADEGKEFSALEVDTYVEQTMERAGAKKVFDGIIPRAESTEVLTREFTSKFSNGLCWPTEPVRTYVIHRTDRAIWVHACSYGGIGAAWVIAEDTRVAEKIDSAVQSQELRARLDADGRVDLSIQFESDSSKMLSGSQQQIAEIAEMMAEAPELTFSVNGYTDNSGAAERNKQLSLERAQTIVNELIKRGVDRKRLRAHGFGRERPLADNATPEGRAKNRRVELERI